MSHHTGVLSTIGNVTVSRTLGSDRVVARHLFMLLPFLGLYAALILLTSSPILVADEGGYAENAARMLYGPAVTPHDLRLWWGPGYPFVLIPFIALGLPWIAAKLLNAVFLFGAIAYFYALLRRYVTTRAALIVTALVGMYPPFLRGLPMLIPETLAIFLVCGLLHHFCVLCTSAKHSRLHLPLAVLWLTWLVLVKVFFGYVVTALLLLSLPLLAWKRTRPVRLSAVICLLVLFASIPYLLYTYSLTGKLFYWGTSGGMSLYWMSSPYSGEYGSWFSAKQVEERPELAPHRPFFASIEPLSDVQRDDAFKNQARYNILHHPAKYLSNCMANVGRLLFSYPFSFGPHSLSTYFYLVPNMFIVVLFVLSTIPAALRWRAIPAELWAILVFAAVAFGGSMLLSAYDRQFRPLVPMLSLWLAFVYVRVLRIELRTSAEISKPAWHKASGVEREQPK